MKAELVTKEEPKTFKPVTFQVTCESQEELDFWASIFNHAKIELAAKKFGCQSDGIYFVPCADFLTEAGAKIDVSKLSDCLFN